VLFLNSKLLLNKICAGIYVLYTVAYATGMAVEVLPEARSGMIDVVTSFPLLCRYRWMDE